MRFVYNGERISELIRGAPTVGFILEVERKRERIQQLIGLGKYGEQDYLQDFPNSQRKTRDKAQTNRELTIGEALEDWYSSRINTIGPNTDDDYIRSIRNQLLPLKLPAGLVPGNVFVPPTSDYIPPEEWSRSRYQGGPVRPVNPLDKQIFAHLPISLLTDVLINAIRTELLKDVGIKRVNNLMSPLRGAMERQVKLRVIPMNPFDLVSPLRKTNVVIDQSGERSGSAGLLRNQVDDLGALDMPLPDDDRDTFLNDEGDPDPLTEDEMLRLLAQMDAPMANQFTFAFWTGLRTGEIIALRWSDIQFSQGRFLVRRSVSRGCLKTTKTNKQRWVKLIGPALIALHAQWKLSGAEKGWVFPNPFTRKRWANDSKITKRWTVALEKAGVRYRRPYQTRHTYASMMLSSGENPVFVAPQMGHVDWSMLVKVYARWMPSSAGVQPGERVAQVQEANWDCLAKLLAERERVAVDADDYKFTEDFEAVGC
jgi:integrase